MPERNVSVMRIEALILPFSFTPSHGQSLSVSALQMDIKATFRIHIWTTPWVLLNTAVV